jgi:hypothetical protein
MSSAFERCNTAAMRRRTLLRLGLGGAAVLALAGGGVALLRPGLRDGRLTPAGRSLFEAVASAVLDDALPTDTSARRAALADHLDRLDATLAGFPPHLRRELSDLIALLDAAPGRWLVCGLRNHWSTARTNDIRAALQAMRESTIALRQQAYHALRDLSNAAYFADPSTWPLLGYPGPRAMQ